MSTTLQQAINAIRLGDKETGKRLLTQALQANPQDETAWLWLAYAVDSIKQRRECLERVLTINPTHPKAQRGLATLGLEASSPARPAQLVNCAPAKTRTNGFGDHPPLEYPAPPAPLATPAPAVAAAEEITPKKEEKPGFHLPLAWTVACLLLTLAIFIGANPLERWAMWSQLAQSGVTTRATVIDARTGPGNAYYVTYRFSVPKANGEFSLLQTEERVSQEFYNLLEPNSLVKVQYLFENPAVVRLGGKDNFDNLLIWTLIGLVTGVTGLYGLVGAMGQARSWSQTVFKKKPPKPKVVWQGEGPPPLKQWSGTYTLGQDNYEGFFVIETDDGIFLGEGGMEIFKTIPDTQPKQPLAFDVGLFDKTDITTLSRVIMSESAYHDETLRATIEARPHAAAILAAPGAQFTLESTAMRVEAKIDELEYGEGGTVYFNKLSVSLSIFVKEGVDLAQPMDIPDQFK